MDDVRIFDGERWAERSMQELLGFIKGIVADRAVNEKEAAALEQWIQLNRVVAKTWPGNVIAARLQHVFADGMLNEDERESLEDLLRLTVGDHDESAGAMVRATGLPLNDPVPTILFESRSFCLTGVFVSGTRRNCERAIEDHAGIACRNLTRKTDYLVIGTLSSQGWVHSTHGRKIEEAVQMRDEHGLPIAIICEQDWARSLEQLT